MLCLSPVQCVLEINVNASENLKVLASMLFVEKMLIMTKIDKKELNSFRVCFVMQTAIAFDSSTF